MLKTGTAPLRQTDVAMRVTRSTPATRLRGAIAAAARPAEDYRLISGLFLRLLALVYLAAFASLAGQITGLAGSQGILPFTDQLRAAEALHGAWRFLQLPTLFWIDAGDGALRAAAVAGCGFSLLLLLNIFPRLALAALFALYLSLFHAGQVFMNFQWDYLLLEAGFLGIFLPGGARVVIWLYRWLLFRLRFLSGISKLVSGDPSWAGLTALNHYFETQPLPHVGSWYAHQLPEWLLRAGTGAALFTELVVPFMMFLPRPWRLFAAWATIAMQLLIILTSNHNFFNLLTIVLCLFLFDDRALRRVVPVALARRLALHPALPRGGIGSVLRAAGLGAMALLLVTVSATLAGEMILQRPAPAPLAALADWLQPWRIANRYHVFPNMLTERLEIRIEGSRDGRSWRPYVFRYKPGDPARRPAVVIPRQPRLDWMIWFVPLGHPVNWNWYGRFLERLRENSPAVTGLLAENPFPGAPPRFLRASLWRYRFTDARTRAETGDWWTREYLGPFPALPAPGGM